MSIYIVDIYAFELKMSDFKGQMSIPKDIPGSQTELRRSSAPQRLG